MPRPTLGDRLQNYAAEKRLRWISRSLSHFVLHAVDDDELPLNTAVIERELQGEVSPTLFLDFYSRSGMELALREYGLWSRLEARGHQLELEFAREGPWRHVFRLRDRGLPSDENLLVELCARFLTLVGHEGGVWPATLDRAEALAIEWLMMQNPRATFTPLRPPLPGQAYPGLGIGRDVMGLLEIMAERLGREALIAVPQHYHNGFLYDRRFRFVDPAREGELHALERDLAGLDLATASWAVELGLVDDLERGDVFRWRPEEMLRPLTPRLSTWFESEEWRNQRRAAFLARRFRVRSEGLAPLQAALAQARRPAGAD